MATAITEETRRRALELMGSDEGLDVLVIGGGVTGAGIALDAATRGLRTGIVEAQDWASGTSSRSSKLVHGGLRYLQMLDFALVQEALTERDLLLKHLAPHLVKPVPFLYPLGKAWERPYVGAGVGLYDVLATVGARKGRAMPIHRHIGSKKLAKLFPDLRADAAIGAVEYWDASVDDARLVLTLVRTAADFGALAAARTQVVGLTRVAGAVDGAVLRDLQSGREFPVRARSVIAATGVWTEETESLSGAKGGLQVLASKGIHIVVPRDRIRGEVGLILQTEKSVLFIIPWSRYWVIGTTDTPYEQDLVHPVASAADIEYVIDHANAVLENPISRDDIIGTWAGLRPLLQPGTKEGTSSAKVSREHTVASPIPGLVSIAGGKLTTYRVMAKDAVDFALGHRAKELPCLTDQIPLIGAVGLEAMHRRSAEFTRRFGWDQFMIDHLLHRYGSSLRDLLAAIDDDPGLGVPLQHAPAYLRAEIRYAATHEQVLHLDDLMERRTRLVYEVADAGRAVLDEVLEIIAPVLGWDAERVERERSAYLAACDARDAAARATTDEDAADARLAADDPAPMVRLATV